MSDKIESINNDVIKDNQTAESVKDEEFESGMVIISDADDNQTDDSKISEYVENNISNIYEISGESLKTNNKRINFIKKKYVILPLIIFVILILVFTDIIPILPNAYNRLYVGRQYVIGETQGGVYDKLGSSVIYVGNGITLVFGPDMKCKLKSKSPVGIPCLETNGSNAIVYYQNSSNVAIIKNENKINNKIKIDNIVTAASINKNAYYGFVYNESGYKKCISVYDKNDVNIYKWHTNNHIIDIAISNDGNNMVATGYSVNNNSIAGKLLFFDLNKEQPIKEVSLESNIISEVYYADDNTIIAFGDSNISGYTEYGELLWRNDYNGKVPKKYDINSNGNIAIVFDRYSSELSESTLEIYNKAGKLVAHYESDENIKHVSANNNHYLLSLEKKTLLLDDDCKVKKKKNVDKEYRKAILYDNYNFAFSISDSVAEIMSVNH